MCHNVSKKTKQLCISFSFNINTFKSKMIKQGHVLMTNCNGVIMAIKLTK